MLKSKIVLKYGCRQQKEVSNELKCPHLPYQLQFKIGEGGFYFIVTNGF
jgi:hypothetical protein